MSKKYLQFKNYSYFCDTNIANNRELTEKKLKNQLPRHQNTTFGIDKAEPK